MKEIKNKVNTNKITEGSIFGQLLLFFFPILFGTFFQQLYNTADAVVVGRFVGKQALAAVGGTTSTLINLLVGFFVGLSSGATVVISQFYGARKPDKVHWAVHTAVAFSLIGGVLFMIIGVVFAHMALSAMHTPEDVLTYAVVYIRIYFLGMIPNLIYNMGAGICVQWGLQAPLIFPYWKLYGQYPLRPDPGSRTASGCCRCSHRHHQFPVFQCLHGGLCVDTYRRYV